MDQALTDALVRHPDPRKPVRRLPNLIHSIEKPALKTQAVATQRHRLSQQPKEQP